MNKKIEDHEISAACIMGFLENRLSRLETEFSKPNRHVVRTRLSARINETREMLIQVENALDLLSRSR